MILRFGDLMIPILRRGPGAAIVDRAVAPSNEAAASVAPDRPAAPALIAWAVPIELATAQIPSAAHCIATNCIDGRHRGRAARTRVMAFRRVKEGTRNTGTILCHECRSGRRHAIGWEDERLERNRGSENGDTRSVA
jgi:hypothetical protein